MVQDWRKITQKHLYWNLTWNIDLFENDEVKFIGKDICKEYITQYLKSRQIDDLMQNLLKKEEIAPRIWEWMKIYFTQKKYDSLIYYAWEIPVPKRKIQPKRTTSISSIEITAKKHDTYRCNFIYPIGMNMEENKEWNKDHMCIGKTKGTRNTIKKSKSEDMKYFFIALLAFFVCKCFCFRLLDSL